VENKGKTIERRWCYKLSKRGNFKILIFSPFRMKGILV
jgi:hypothetical protein